LQYLIKKSLKGNALAQNRAIGTTHGHLPKPELISLIVIVRLPHVNINLTPIFSQKTGILSEKKGGRKTVTTTSLLPEKILRAKMLYL